MEQISITLNPKSHEFAPPECWPRAGEGASARETQLLDTLVSWIEIHAQGLYLSGLEKSHLSNTGVSEHNALLDPDFRKYLQKPGNLFEEMQKLSATLTDSESLLLYAVLMEIELHRPRIDDLLVGDWAKQVQFDLSHALKIAGPIINYYLSKRLPPEFHKVPGKIYSEKFMDVRGLRPNTAHTQILVTEQIIYHASCAILLDALKVYKFPEIFQQTQAKFDKNKRDHRHQVWRVVTAPDFMPGQIRDEFIPPLPSNPFAGYDFGQSARILPAFVDIPLPETPNRIETQAAVVVHPENKRCLIEFYDHTLPDPVMRYAVSQDQPPMEPDAQAQVFDSLADALACWNAAPARQCPFRSEPDRHQAEVCVKPGMAYGLAQFVDVSGLLKEVSSYWASMRDHWFAKSEAFDAMLSKRYLDVYQAAARGEFDEPALSSALSALGLVLLLDQFPRNAFRGTMQMYATDAKARHIAQGALAVRYDLEVDAELRLFFYLPFAHSEKIADQDRSVMLNRLLGPSQLRHAEGHRDIIRQFGRFPHRNAVFGRTSRPEELDFLARGGFAG